MAATTKQIEQRIASKDFLDRLRVVRIDDGWWPALQFEGMKDLTDTLNLDFSIDTTRRFKATILTKLRKEGGMNGKFAYLLRRDSVVLLPDSKPELAKDFYDHYEEMMEGSEQLKSVAEFAINRVDEVLPEVEASAVVVAGVEKETSDVGKGVECVEEADNLACAAAKPSSEGKSSDVLSIHESGYVPSTAKKAKGSKHTTDTAGKKKGTGGRKKSAAAKTVKKSEGKAEVEGHVETPVKKKEHDNLPVEEVTSESKDHVSPLKSPSADGESISIANASPPVTIASRASRHVPECDKDAPWAEFWGDMKRGGWTYTNGDALNAFYWVHPTHAHLKKKELLEIGTKGKDYFTSEEEVKYYAKKKYGWLGHADTPISTGLGAELVERVKRGNRTCNVTAKREAQLKLGAPKERKGPSSSNSSSSSVDANSRFSLVDSVDVSSKEQVVKGKRLSYGGQKMDSVMEQPVDSLSTTSVDTSVDPTYQVMKSRDAWKLLMDVFGFTYNRDKYCLPGKENRPGDNPNAQEGINFFSTIEDLRKNLCAYGLPEPKKELGPEKEDFCRWVRYAHVRGISDGACINQEYIGEPITQRVAWSYLTRLGFRFTSCYVIPEPASREAKRFESAEDFYVHLARFGIPNCDVAPGPSLDPNERLKLDLFVYNPGKHLDTFKRINPESNEITPRRCRVRSNPIPQSNTRVNTSSVNNSLKMKSTNQSSRIKKTQPSKFEEDFTALERHRELPCSLISSQEASNLLQNYYGITREGSSYCFTDPLTKKELKFGNVQSLRENLCAYGLPSPVSDIGVDDLFDLESWIRCAHIGRINGEHSSIPYYNDMDYKKAGAAMKALGYQTSKAFSKYALPDANFHNPVIGQDGWNNLLDFFNHIARFGLAGRGENDKKSALPKEEVIQFMICVVIHSTSDIRNRIKCNVPIKRVLPEQTQDAIFSDEVGTDEDQGLLTQPANMIEEHESPHRPTPPGPKSPTPKQAGILGYLTKKVKDIFTPNRTNTKHPSSHDNDESSQSTDPTPSWLGKGDADLEACFEDSSFKHSAAVRSSAEIQKDDGSASQQAHGSPSKRKAEDEPSYHAAKTLKVDTAEEFDWENARSCAASDPNISWRDMRLQMTNDGLSYLRGSDLEGFYYVHPARQGVKKNELIRGGYKEGEDYFLTEESLMKYARDKFGWAGEIESEALVGGRRSRKESISYKSPPKRAAPEGKSSSSKKPRKSPTSKPSMKDASSTNEPTVSDGILDDHSICLPDLEPTVKERLEAAKMVLHQGYAGNYCAVSSKTSQITQFLESSVVNGPSRSQCLYVCGRPGTGKTTVVSQCASDVKTWARKEGQNVPLIHVINVSSLSASASTKDGVMKAMLKHAAKKFGLEKPSIESLEKQAKKRILILIIDEVDMLIKSSDGERFFCELVRLANEEHLSFSLIGISNSVNDESSARIKELATPQEIVFSSYDENELLGIITRRVGMNTVEQKALELVSRKVAATHGDARKVLEIVSNAVGHCMDSLSEAELVKEVSNDDSPPVKIKHMMRAIRESNLIKYAEIIRKLPQLAKIVLCIAVAYGHFEGPNAEISLGYLRNLCQQATKYDLFEDMDSGSICSLCEQLCDTGLLRVANNDSFDSSDTTTKLRIDVQLDDVECALEESLLNGTHGEFYSRLMEFVQKRHN